MKPMYLFKAVALALLLAAAAALGGQIPHVFGLAVEHGSVHPAPFAHGLLGQVLQALAQALMKLSQLSER